MRLSVIIPTLNEERVVGATLDAIRGAAPAAEIIVADGGSMDHTVEVARTRGAQTLTTRRGRAFQMNAGAAAAECDTLVFVHADTRVPATFPSDIAGALANSAIVGGRFDVEFDDSSFAPWLLAKLISLRSRVMRSATGDQAIFVRRRVFEAMGGYTEINLCEDVDFARRLKRNGRVACLHSRVVTSARRWRQNGMIRTILRMWLIKSLFLAGVSPAKLHRYYADVR
ncbi:MAG: TIGR04283 family arsenosugar biosynthesis glycosyltransferase [Deltaproteobacteria bacterium]|nr:TIGR04283 family arsenosugar biosynthesis glycosyltransferase [Deltaproteobacteria bacterium]